MSWDEIDVCMRDCDSFLMDVIIDTSGNAEALNKAVKLLQIKGRLLIFGVADPAVRIE